MPGRTAQAPGTWVGMSVDHAISNRFSFMVEGTWRDPAVPLSTAEAAREAGYRTHAVGVAVPAVTSRLATLERYYRDVDSGHDARWTPMEAHDLAARNLTGTVQALGASPAIDRITVVTRSAEVLYNSDATATPERGMEAAAAHQARMDQPLTPDEARAWVSTARAMHRAHQEHTRDDPRARFAWKEVGTRDLPVMQKIAGLSTAADPTDLPTFSPAARAARESLGARPEPGTGQETGSRGINRKHLTRASS